MDKLHLNIAIIGEDNYGREQFILTLSHPKIKTRLLNYSTGLELIDSVKQSNNYLPDVIFRKMNQPFRNGLKCITDIRKEFLLQRALLIVYAPMATEDEVENAFVAKANIFMHSPQCTNNLTEKIEEILKLTIQYKNSDLNIDTLLQKM